MPLTILTAENVTVTFLETKTFRTTFASVSTDGDEMMMDYLQSRRALGIPSSLAFTRCSVFCFSRISRLIVVLRHRTPGVPMNKLKIIRVRARNAAARVRNDMRRLRDEYDAVSDCLTRPNLKASAQAEVFTAGAYRLHSWCLYKIHSPRTERHLAKAPSEKK